MAPQQQEPYVSVPQPGATDPSPVYDSAHPPVGSFPTDRGTLSPSVAVADGKVFVASQEGIQARDASTLALLQTFPSPPGGSIRTAQGLAYYRGELFVSDPGWNSVGRVVVYDESGNYKRTLPGQYAGIDVAWGEIWGRPPNYPARLEAREIQTGAVRAEVPLGNQPPYANCPPDDNTSSALGCSPTAWQAGTPPSQDVSVAADSNGIFTGPYSASRGLASDFLSFSTSPLTGTNGIDLTCPNGHIQPDAPLRQRSGSGSSAVWGMQWFITTTNCGSDATNPGPRVAEYAITNDAIGKPTLTYARGWIPGTGTSTEVAGAFSDVAYQAHRPRIDWVAGNLADPIHWMQGSQCVRYVVSDGDYYVAADALAHYLRPAPGFSPPVRLYLDDMDPGHTTPVSLISGDPTQATGTLCFDTMRPFGSTGPTSTSGSHAVTMTATVSSQQVARTNPTLHIDHDPPAGTIDALPYATNATVNAMGTIADTHSGPRSWQLQVSGPGTGGWQTACTTTAPDPGTGKWGCAWDSTTYPESTYQTRALLTDQVQAGYGGANTSVLTGPQVIVDRTPPAVDNTAPDISEAMHEAATRDNALVRWTQSDGASGVASTTVDVNAASDGSADGQWAPVGTSGASGEASTAWDVSGLEGGLYRLRARACDRASNCGTTAWQAIVVSKAARRLRHACPGQYVHCYAGESLGGPNDAAYGLQADLRTPAAIPHQEPGKYAQEFSVDYVNMGNPNYGGGSTLQTGLSTASTDPSKGHAESCGHATKGPTDPWYQYEELVSPSVGGVIDCPRRPATGSTHTYRVLVGVGDSGDAFARAYIDGRVQMIRRLRNRRVFRLVGSGAEGADVEGEVSNTTRQMAGFYSNVLVNIDGNGLFSPDDDNHNLGYPPRPSADTGYVFFGSHTKFCVSDKAHATARGCTAAYR
ncbi:MAG: hypothetical protein QOE65_410 [Solirubrobacteraceae bacterium]|nr:hypothetical protein [Solirubrobacteraceae bacterium]